MDKCKLAVFLVLWYGSSTWNGISSKHLLHAASVSSSNIIIILQGAIALSFAQLLLTGAGGLGASFVQEHIRSHHTHKGIGTQVGLAKTLSTCYASSKWRRLTILIGCINFLGVLATNLSFFLGSVSLTHLIKASEPVITSAYSFVIAPESSLSSKRFAGMLLITLGVATASYSNKTSAYYGCAAALISSLLFPLRNVLIKRMVSKPVKDDITMSGIHLFFVISLVSSIIGACIIASLNMSPVIRLPWMEHLRMILTSSGQKVVYFDTLMSTCTFLLYNTFSMIVLQRCTVSTHAIFNILKRGVVILISAALIDHNLNQHLVGGTALAMMGLWLYKS